MNRDWIEWVKYMYHYLCRHVFQHCTDINEINRQRIITPTLLSRCNHSLTIFCLVDTCCSRQFCERKHSPCKWPEGRHDYYWYDAYVHGRDRTIPILSCFPAWATQSRCLSSWKMRKSSASFSIFCPCGEKNVSMFVSFATARTTPCHRTIIGRLQRWFCPQR